MASTVIGTLTVPWIPVRHRMDLLLTDALPGDAAVSTAFALVIDGPGRTLLTRVDLPGRGWEAPGGHVDAGEHPRAAAARELAEETGFELEPAALTLAGGLRITLLDAPPAGHPYPARTFMAFYTARLDHRGEPTRPTPGFECAEAEWVERDELPTRCPKAPWLNLHTTLFAWAPLRLPDREFRAHPCPR